MYLEISARQTGKTERLAKAVVEWLVEDKNHRAILVGMQSNRYYLYDQVKEFILTEVYKIIKDQIIDIAEAAWILEENIRIFYDEFDYHHKSVLVNKNDYYVTTIKGPLDLSRIHDISYAPLAMRLIRANDYYFESYTCYENIDPALYAIQHKPTFEIECCGKIFEQDDVSGITGCFYNNQKLD